MKNWKFIVQEKVIDEMRGNFEQNLLESLIEWLKQNLNDFGVSYNEALLFLNLCVLKLRGTEMFEIVTQYPESTIAIHELKEVVAYLGSNGSASRSGLKDIGIIFRDVIVKRLLHPGASTVQILEVYVTLIKALRELDPLDILLNYVAVPIRAYLVRRTDTMSCIISSLIYDCKHCGNDSAIVTDLYKELRGNSNNSGVVGRGNDSDVEAAGPGVHWEPRQRDKSQLLKRLYNEKYGKQENSRVSGYGLDIFALLVSLYGSADVFVKEYQRMLKDRLIFCKSQHYNYELDQEVTNLELLKIRFGDDPLHDCEVMVHDVEQSKRVNTACNEYVQAKQEYGDGKRSIGAYCDCKLDCVSVSNVYWPGLPGVLPTDNSEETVKKEAQSIPPPQICPQYHPLAVKLMTDYYNAFYILKKPRKLVFVGETMFPEGDDESECVSSGGNDSLNSAVGFVELELEFSCGVRRFIVTPLQASVILFMNDYIEQAKIESGNTEYTVSLSQIAELMSVPLSQLPTLQNLISFWVSRKIVRETAQESLEDPVYSILDDDQADRITNTLEGVFDTVDNDNDFVGTEADQIINSSAFQNQRNSALETYVKGLLINNKHMALDRLHSMLKMLEQAGDDFVYGLANSIALKAFLQGMIERNIIEYIDGNYMIASKI